MNNKKLFKGALVLFASILMAVSCSSNSNPNDNNDSNSNNNNNNNTVKPTEISKTQIQTAAIAGLGGDGQKLTVGDSENKITLNKTSVTIETSADTVTIKVSGQESDSSLADPKISVLKKSIETLIASEGTLKKELDKVGIVLTKSTIDSPTGTGGKVATANITATLKENYKIEGVTGTLSKVVITVDVSGKSSANNWVS